MILPDSRRLGLGKFRSKAAQAGDLSGLVSFVGVKCGNNEVVYSSFTKVCGIRRSGICEGTHGIHRLIIG
jgi:hypothetical protein